MILRLYRQSLCKWYWCQNLQHYFGSLKPMPWFVKKCGRKMPSGWVETSKSWHQNQCYSSLFCQSKWTGQGSNISCPGFSRQPLAEILVSGISAVVTSSGPRMSPTTSGATPDASDISTKKSWRVTWVSQQNKPFRTGTHHHTNKWDLFSDQCKTN